MQSNNLPIKILFFILLVALYHPIYGKNIDTNKSKIQHNLEKKQQDSNTKLIKMLEQSSLLVAQGEKEKDFNYILDFINNTINIYGEDSENTILGYLALTRHYIGFHKFKNADALFTFIEEIKENRKYENNPILKILILHLKSDIYMKNKKYKKAYSLLVKAIKISETLEIESGFRMSLYNSYTQVLTALKRYKEAERIAKKTLGLYRKTTKNIYDKESLIKVFVNYGGIYEKENNYLLAHKTMDIGLSILSHEEALGNLSIPLLNFFLQYAMYSYATQNYEDTIFAAEMAIEIERKLKIKDKINQPYMWELTGMSYKKQKKYQKAKKSYEKAIKKLEESHLDDEKKEKVRIRIKKELNLIENFILNDLNQTK